MRVNDVCPLMQRIKCTPWCLTFISKNLWWFLYLINGVFSKKITSRRIPVISNSSTPDHRHHPADKTRLLLMAIPATVNTKANSRPFRSGAYATAVSWQRLSPCLGRKWHSPIPMAGRSAATVQNHWNSSVQPVLQLSWEFGRREGIQEQAALWQQRISHLNWDKMQGKDSTTPSLGTRGMQHLMDIWPKFPTLSPIYTILSQILGELITPIPISIS